MLKLFGWCYLGDAIWVMLFGLCKTKQFYLSDKNRSIFSHMKITGERRVWSPQNIHHNIAGQKQTTGQQYHSKIITIYRSIYRCILPLNLIGHQGNLKISYFKTRTIPVFILLFLATKKRICFWASILPLIQENERNQRDAKPCMGIDMGISKGNFEIKSTIQRVYAR